MWHVVHVVNRTKIHKIKSKLFPFAIWTKTYLLHAASKTGYKCGVTCSNINNVHTTFMSFRVLFSDYPVRALSCALFWFYFGPSLAPSPCCWVMWGLRSLNTIYYNASQLFIWTERIRKSKYFFTVCPNCFHYIESVSEAFCML
jgi:hypothetical protein